jgi:hypothetical protein
MATNAARMGRDLILRGTTDARPTVSRRKKYSKERLIDEILMSLKKCRKQTSTVA